MNRRTFLQVGGGGVATAWAISGWLSAHAGESAVSGSAGKVLVWLELRGGNDGLNTVIPFRDPIYRKARPTLAVSEGPVLTRELILHPALAPLQLAWKTRRLAFALGVGWAKPNRSHFKAMDQWATASPSGSGIGWLAATMDQRGSPGPLVALGPSGSTALEGGVALDLQMAPALFQDQEAQFLRPSRAGSNVLLRKMLELELAGNEEIQRLRGVLGPLPAGLDLPRSGLGQQVALALRLIGSGAAPPVIQMAQGGYDTHAAQAVRHPRALSELAEALAAFDRGLQSLKHRPQVTLLATSEFGRRLRENESGGTDHGSASISLLMGDHVPHPFLGTYPALSQLDDRGDPLATLAPPQLYQQALKL
ncbi:hypothetical protein BBFGKLBO_02370 [Synechococcus sp. CBW1107]|jgi:uncharacterized protein (DUF1501 family)|nr:hypothetical protein BBFGKLBO_02370 [Synechococcus sp. CBW1107]